MLAGAAEAAPVMLTPISQDLIVGQRESGAPLNNGYHTDPTQSIGAGVTGGSGSRYNRNAVIGFLLPTLTPGEVIDSASFRITIANNNSAGGGKPVALYGLSTANPDNSGTMLFTTDTQPGTLANAGHALISATFSSTGNSSGNPQADVSEFIRSFYTGHVPHQPEVYFRICPTQNTWATTNRLDFTKGSARLEVTTVPGPQVLHRRVGSDPTFQQLIDSGVIVPGVSSASGPVPGSAIHVNRTMLEQQTGVTGSIASAIRIHTQVNSSVLRSSFPNFTRWYQEDGKVQVMRLFQAEQNVRSGVGETGTPGRIEAFFPMFTVNPGTWSVWEGTYTIIEPLGSNIFQLFHEGGQLWAFHLRMNSAGAITFNRRREIAGLPTNITIATNMTGRSISFRIRANGSDYEVFKKIPGEDPAWVLVTTGSYTQAVNNQISFRWGMYVGSQAGASVPKDGLLLVSGATRTTSTAPGVAPPPPPPPPATYYWDSNGAAAGFGTAGGVWGETTTGNTTQGWSTDATGATLPVDTSTFGLDSVFFGTNVSGGGLGTGTVTVSDTVTCADLTFGSQSGNLTLAGGEIYQAGDRTINVAGTGKTHTIFSELSGFGTRTIGGGSTLQLFGGNSFVEALIIGDNTSSNLRVRFNTITDVDGGASSLGAPLTTANGIVQLGSVSHTSTLEFTNASAAQSTNRRIRIGSNSNGSGGATILNNNSNPEHTLTFSNSSFNPAATGITTSNRTLTLGGSNTGDNIIHGAIIDNVGTSGGRVRVAKTGSGTWVFNGANSYSNGTTISDGILRIGTGGTSGSLPTSSHISNHGILEFRRSNTLTQGTDFTAEAISGTGAIIQSGTGTTILNAPNTYEGPTTISAGALRVLHANALGSSSSGTVVNGVGTGGSAIARLELAGGIRVTGEALRISGGGNFRGALTSESGENEWAGPVTLAAPGARIGAGNDATLRVSGVIDSGGAPHGLVIRGGALNTPAVILTAANSYLGDTTLLSGKLQLDGGNNRLPVTTRLVLGNSDAASEFDLNGRHQQLAGLAIAAGAIATNHSLTNSSTTLSTLTVHTAAGFPSTYIGILKGNLALVKTGTDTLTLTGANRHSGPTTIAAGTLALTGASLESPITVASGASLAFSLASPATSPSSLNLANGTVKIIGAVDGQSDYRLITATGGISGTPVLDEAIPGYALNIEGGGTELVLSYTGAPSAFGLWSGGAAADHDSSGDGLPNAIAWALGAASPFESARSLLPTLDNTGDPDYLLFAFNRSDAAEADPGTAIAVEFGTTLSAWTTAVHDGDNVIIQVTDGSPTDAVVVKLKRSTLAPAGSLFTRLKVVIDAP